jgi:hypothetical protein
MAQKHVINVDLADVWATKQRKNLLRTLAWGDEVTVTDRTRNFVEVRLPTFDEAPDGSILPKVTTGYISPSQSSDIKAVDAVIPKRENKVLKVNFVDVQQGDGSVIESPAGKVILIDGGDNQLFALGSEVVGHSPVVVQNWGGGMVTASGGEPLRASRQGAYGQDVQ